MKSKHSTTHIKKIHAHDNDFCTEQNNNNPLQFVAFLVVHDFQEKLGVFLNDRQLISGMRQARNTQP
jgi:hypothetical protein